MASKIGPRNMGLRLLVLAAIAVLVVGCPSGPPAGGDVHVKVTTTFDERATDDVYWHVGTLSAEGSFPAARLDTMDIGAEYARDLLGTEPWTASTDQQMGDFVDKAVFPADHVPLRPPILPPGMIGFAN